MIDDGRPLQDQVVGLGHSSISPILLPL
jgi:hypothetical protein